MHSVLSRLRPVRVKQPIKIRLHPSSVLPLAGADQGSHNRNLSQPSILFSVSFTMYFTMYFTMSILTCSYVLPPHCTDFMSIIIIFKGMLLLLILLVAVTVFKIISAMSYRGLTVVQKKSTCLINNFTVMHARKWLPVASQCDFSNFPVPKTGNKFTKTFV